MSRPVIFLDDGGVMNENRLRGEQFRQLLSEFMPSVLGGTPERWAEANREVAGRMLEIEAWNDRAARALDYDEFDRAWQWDWIEGMCRIVGVEPPSEGESYAIARRAAVYVTHRIRASFPGAVDAIRAVHSSGYTLHTASGEPSWDLEGYLAGMGVRECFGHLYGPDLVNILKMSPEYYVRLLADAGVSPADALFIDDSPLALGWAREAGARGVLVGAPLAGKDGDFPRIASLAELPGYLEAL